MFGAPAERSGHRRRRRIHDLNKISEPTSSAHWIQKIVSYLNVLNCHFSDISTADDSCLFGAMQLGFSIAAVGSIPRSSLRCDSDGCKWVERERYPSSRWVS